MKNFELQIDKLQLHVSGVAGGEERLRTIAGRAAAILAVRLDESAIDSRSLRRAPQSIPLQLRDMNDEEAANVIADGWLQAIAPKLVL